MKYQVVGWYPDWRGFGFRKAKGGLAMVYCWYLNLGYWEIRRWKTPKGVRNEMP